MASATNPPPSASQPGIIYLLTALAGIGGFLFGYDTGVVSGAMVVIVEEEDGLLSSLAPGSPALNLWHELIVSGTVVAAAVFALGAGIMADWVGRKVTVLAASVVFAVGAVLMGVAWTKEWLLVGRLIVGAGIGLASMVVPIYISEAAPVHLRGPLTVSYNTLVVAGQFCATLVCGAFSNVDNGWRYMLGLAAVPAAIQFLGFLFMPRSSRWLASKGRMQEAEEVLTWIRPRGTPVKDELESIKASIDSNKGEEGLWTVVSRAMKHPPTRRAMAIGCSLQVFQQLSGINTLMYYSASVVVMAGVADISSAIWISAIISGMYLVSCVFGIVLVERLGRRKLLLISIGGVVLSLILIGVGFHLADSQSPAINVHSINASSCGYSSCSACIQDQECGYCHAANVSMCLQVDPSLHNSSLNGPCSVESFHQEDFVWSPTICPTSSPISWTIIAGLAAYLVAFAWGMAPLPWTINSEIYPMWVRSFATSLSTATNWSFNFLISMTFLDLTMVLHRSGAFFLFCGISLLALVLFYLVLPETKGRSLEEMETIFSGPLLVLNQKKK